MTLLEKILLILLGVVVVSAGGFVIYKEQEMAKMQATIADSNIVMKQLKDNEDRSSSSYASKDDLAAFAKANQINLDTITQDLKTLNASLVGVNVSTISSNAQNQSGISSTSQTPDSIQAPTQTVACSANGTAVCPINQYENEKQNLVLNEAFANLSVPIGSVSFDASNKTAPWSKSIAGRTYNIDTILATQPNGKDVVYNKASITIDGKNYELPISKSTFVQQYPNPSFSWWNPRLNLFITGNINFSKAPLQGDAIPGLSLNLMSYGKSLVSPDIEILGVGLGYEVNNQKVAVVLNPVSFNIGRLIPGGVVNNTFIGPSIALDTQGNILAGAALSVGF